MTQITTVSTKGQLVIPADIRESMGIAPGTRLAVTQQGSRIILEPVSEVLVDTTRGMLAGKTSLSGVLQRQRRQDDRNRKW